MIILEVILYLFGGVIFWYAVNGPKSFRNKIKEEIENDR